MLSRSIVALAACAIAAQLSPSTAAQVPVSGAQQEIKIRMPRSVIEGERFKVHVTVARPAEAKAVTLEERGTNVFGDTTWSSVKSKAVNGRNKLVIKTLVDEDGSGRYRAVVSYRYDKPARSKPARTQVWRWTYLYDFDSYYSTAGVAGQYGGGFAMNGTQYNGWSTYGDYPSWEERFTLGRHCSAIRGDVGVTDDSGDGTSATIALAGDGQPLFTSATLTPGMVQRVELKLGRPYRLSIQAVETSAADLRVYPAIGTPELLCTGL
jgi:hypothetical protein